MRQLYFLIILTPFFLMCKESNSQSRSDLWHAQIYQFGSIRHEIISDTSELSFDSYGRIKHPILELNYTDELFYINFNALSFLIAAIVNMPDDKSVYYPALEFGWGWNLGDGIRLGNNSDMKLGIGFNLGLSAFNATGPVNIKERPAYIGPTIGASIQCGDKLHFQNVLELEYAVTGEGKRGLRTRLYSLVSYKITDNFGVSFLPELFNYNMEEENENPDASDVRFKYKVRLMQFGINVQF